MQGLRRQAGVGIADNLQFSGIGPAGSTAGVAKVLRDETERRQAEEHLRAYIWSGQVKWSGHYLIDPWNANGLVELDKYPRLKAYYQKHGAALKKRHTAKNNKTGWFNTIDRVIHTLTHKPKLYIADIKNVLDPVLDQGDTYPHHNLYFIQSDAWDLEVLGGLLMSVVGQFFVSSYGVRMRGGYLRFQAQYLRRIRVPDPGSMSERHKTELRGAFRARDRQRATLSARSGFTGLRNLSWRRRLLDIDKRPRFD